MGMKCKVLLTAFLTFSCIIARAQLANQPVAPLKIEESKVSSALRKFSEQAQVPIGFEEDLNKADTPLKISLTTATVKDFLAAVVAANPNYTWVEQDGVINVMPIHRPDSFLDVTISKIDIMEESNQDYNDVYRFNAYGNLLHTPEAKHWSERTGINSRIMLGTSILVPGQGVEVPKVIETRHTLTNVTARTYMNELMKLTKSYYWVYNLYGNGNQYFDLQMN